jgi:hypothetical protein
LDLLETIDIKTLKNIIGDYKRKNVDEIYAIRDIINGTIIWNARGSAYKEKADAEKKIKALAVTNKNDFSRYKIITYKIVNEI